MAIALKTLAFEIGTEELPAFALKDATAQLPGLVEKLLNDAAVPHANVSAYTTPRRLIAVVEGVPEATEATESVFRGPSAKIAFDADGNPTKAALGFARGKGVDASALERRDENGTEYVYAVVRTPSRDVASLLPEVLRRTIEGLNWPKSQRWGSRHETFSRPVRWLVALLGEDVVPFEYAGLAAGRTTYGHRFLAPEGIDVATAEDLVPMLRNAYVVPSQDEREEAIRAQVKAVEERTGLVADLPAKTMAEVVNLAEYPTAMVGTFDELFLAVPKEIIVDAMLVHQRYFPLFFSDGRLSNSFIVVSNGNPAFEANIVDGNQRVVAARLYDAKFFYDEDLKHPLEFYVDRLGEVVFQEQLGTTRAKVDRIVELAAHLAADAGLNDVDTADARRAAYLCKADLVTSAVVEFTSVQGIMGRYYAQAAGETEQVAQAISDHYRPRFAGDATPESLVGKVVAAADKLDTICGLFAVGQGPTGSSDPFALRRSAIGILAMLEDGLNVSLVDAIAKSLDLYGAGGLVFDADAVKADVIDFFVKRTSVMLRDGGCEADSIDAVLAVGVEEPLQIVARVRTLEDARANDKDTFDDLATAYARANNLRDADLGAEVDESLFAESAAALSAAVTQAEATVAAALANDDYRTALAELAALRAPIDGFFDKVMVMDENAAVRENNLRLLNRFVGVFANVADFGLMAKAK